MSIRVFLKTELFTLPGEESAIPGGTMVIAGQLKEHIGGGLLLQATEYWDHGGRVKEGKPITLYLSSSKIDHIRYLD